MSYDQEVVVFALSADDGSAERADIRSAADLFLDLSSHPDPGAAMAGQVRRPHNMDYPPTRWP